MSLFKELREIGGESLSESDKETQAALKGVANALSKLQKTAASKHKKLLQAWAAAAALESVYNAAEEEINDVIGSGDSRDFAERFSDVTGDELSEASTADILRFSIMSGLDHANDMVGDDLDFFADGQEIELQIKNGLRKIKP